MNAILIPFPGSNRVMVFTAAMIYLGNLERIGAQWRDPLTGKIYDAPDVAVDALIARKREAAVTC